MTTSAKRLSRRPRLLPLLFQPAEADELCEPGTCGRLRLKAELETETIEHTGRYVYVGSVRGLHAFAPAGDPVLFLHRSEVLSFKR